VTIDCFNSNFRADPVSPQAHYDWWRSSFIFAIVISFCNVYSNGMPSGSQLRLATQLHFDHASVLPGSKSSMLVVATRDRVSPRRETQVTTA
jgi:hypothetical protein